MISFMYKQTVENANYNAAYASAVIAFMITLIATAITFLYEKKGVSYDV
jgi:ABC-type sugar transport system permease subunit